MVVRRHNSGTRGQRGQGRQGRQGDKGTRGIRETRGQGDKENNYLLTVNCQPTTNDQ
ncbi:hypothetical protein [Chroococcidiopsis cubana]|uniref:hypothetical protein n=1 Tax=Chroococcidiopsis cubana TaxID=171392 RepID=UPI002ACDE935|nr:hypothetical protein [Chroococcidiopsis cubana]